MKYTLLLFAAIASFASCTKTKTNTVTVIKTDTVAIKQSLLGTWHSATGLTPIVFGADTLQWASYPPIPYLASPTAIYDLSEANIVFKRWAYSLSVHNDTLMLTTVSTGVTDAYTKS